jgi:protein-disulfide isomerase
VARPAKKNTQKESPLKPFYLVLGLIAVAGVGILMYQTLGRGTAATAPVEVDIDPAELARVQGISMGDPDAPVVIYEFADFQCPGCGQFASLTKPLIEERLVDTGLARFVFYDFPLNSFPHSFLAARAARCANDQGRFWDYHDMIFARQVTLASVSNAAGFFIDLADELGLEGGDFEECLRSDRFAEEVTRSMQLGQSLGVQQTPTLFVNMRRLSGIPPFSELEALVLREAGVASPEPAAAAPDTAASSQ